ncbi:MAG: EAL domain-containing protein [Nitrospinae bacterium]|nr:EAL domain-containing protein [Nitrospinota bacterium]
MSLAQMLLILFSGSMAVAFVFIISASSYLKEKAVADLTQDDARRVSGLVFQSLYSAMSKGWNKDEIQEIIARLNKNDWEMIIRVFRGKPVIHQFGEITGEKEIRDKDQNLRDALFTGKEYFSAEGDRIRYIYPVKVREECLRCHTDAKVGDINGAIDVDFPVKNLKISLSFILNVVSASFAALLIVLFVVLHLILRQFLAKPLIQLVGIIQEIIRHTDLSRRLPQDSGFVRELGMLSTYFNDMLTTMQDYSRQLEELSIRDPLTRLYNRRKFEQFLAHEVNRSFRHKRYFSLIMLDVDNFKHINDTYGHPVGDLALKELAMTLEAGTRDTDIVARIGGDEFAIILPETIQENGVLVAEKLRKMIAAADITLPVGRIRMSASFGLVAFPDNGQTMDEMSIAMDVAMYKAKKKGKNRVATIDISEKEMVADTYNQGERIQKALEEDRLEVHLQPIIDTMTGHVYAYETLARIREDGAIIPAGQFIEVAEELGLSEALDRRMLEKGIQLQRSLANVKGKKLFYNLSPRTFGNDKLMRGIPGMFRDAGISVEDAVFEITEREALPHLGELSAFLNELRNDGMRFALDDFGSGFSSFIYLKYLTVDYIKIEGSFVRHLAVDPSDRIMVTHINGMAHDFGMKVIAEFVEDEAAAQILRELKVDYAQGYYYGKPMSSEDMKGSA